MKEIVLKPVEIYENHMLIDVYDYTYPIFEKHVASVAKLGQAPLEQFRKAAGEADPPDPMKSGKPKLRKRMTIDVDYGAYDVSEIRGECPTLDDALEYYSGYIYKLIRRRILDDWHAESGLQEVLDTIREKIEKYYE